MSVTIKNAKVVFSNMKNKPNPKLLSREFSIELPSDSPEIETLRTQFKELENKAKLAYSEKEGKKVKGASTEKGLGDYLFNDNEYNPGFTRLKFTIFNMKDVEDKKEDGSIVKRRVEKLSPIYKNLDFMYKINNNGQKEYMIPDKDVHWMPLSENIINIECSLVASYNKADNRVTIRLKADDVNILQTSDFGKSSGGFGFLTLDDSNEHIENKVEKKSSVEESDTFTAEELASLDV